MNALLALIKQSCLTTSDVSQMRLGTYLVSGVLLATYVMQVVSTVVSNIVAGRPIAPMDLPIVIGSTVTGLFLAKMGQSLGEK